MKILILTKKFPYPLKEGEPIAIANLSSALHKRGQRISLLAMNTSKHYYDASKLPNSHNYFEEIHTVEINNHITIWGAIRSLLLNRPYILSRFYSKRFEQKLIEILQEKDFDVVQLETIYLAHYIPVIRTHSNAVVAMRAHNVEHRIWERLAKNSKSVWRKWFLKFQNYHLRQFEINQLANYDILVAITQNDLDAFRALGYKNKSIVAPAGIQLSEYKPDFGNFENPLTMAFIGALDWMPNQEGILWFLEKVWQEVLELAPNTELHIAGKNTPHWLKKRIATNVFFHGEVQDAKAFINEHPLFIAPLFSGSGIKIKVLEAMALGRVVLTTCIGLEGIPAIHGEHLFIGDSPESILRIIKDCKKLQSEQLISIGEKARNLIKEHFDNDDIASNVIHAYNGLLPHSFE